MRTREDWLCQQLENDNLKPELRVKYEAELEIIAVRISDAKVRAAADAERRELAKKEELLAALAEREKALAKNMDMSYEAWLTLAKSLYTITANYEVISIARGPQNKRVWEEESEYHARERVYKLIYWKHYDHFVRGNSFSYIPPIKKEVA